MTSMTECIQSIKSLRTKSIIPTKQPLGPSTTSNMKIKHNSIAQGHPPKFKVKFKVKLNHKRPNFFILLRRSSKPS